MPEKTLKEKVDEAASSWRTHHNASLKAEDRSRGRTLADSGEFMRDIAPGWITDKDAPSSGYLEEDFKWLGKLDPGWMNRLPKYESALKAALGISENIPIAMNDALKKLEASPHARDDKFLGYSRPEHVGRYSGTGPLGTPVYMGPSGYVSSYSTELDENVGKGILGKFAPEGDWIRSQPRTGTLAHELGHAKIEKLGTRVPSNIYNRSAQRSVNEAVAGYLGRRMIKSDANRPWGEASEDKSWAAYSGLPSYLRGLDQHDLGVFKEMLKDYEKGYRLNSGEVLPGYPGLHNEVMRVIDEYDTLVAPKGINDTSRGNWSEEGLEYMKKWRKEKGLKEVPEGNLYQRALDAGPYSMRLKGAMKERIA